jgi:uncharacterized protein (DUF983 family)
MVAARCDSRWRKSAIPIPRPRPPAQVGQSGTVVGMDADRSHLPAIPRAFRRRCPWCGGARVFASWFELKPNCPACGYRFEREEGYWVGAMIVVTGLIYVVFAVLMLGVIAFTHPDVPWTPLLVVALALMVVVPVLAYPLAKLLWIAVDLLVHHARGEIPDGAFTKGGNPGTPGA